MGQEEYDFSSGTVVFEIDMMLSSASGRAKHTDIVEQGAWLLEPVRRGLQALPRDDGSGVAFGNIRYMGEGPSGLDALSELDAGPQIGPYPEDAVRVKIAELRGIVMRLGETLEAVLDHVDDPEALLGKLATEDARIDSGLRVVLQVAEWANGSRPLDAIEREEWRRV
ncbi:MAG: hypothetical protein ACRDWD_07555, partial [Acidimicrobiia bacterium]